MSGSSFVDAVVVGGVDYGEADRVVQCLGSEGRFSAFAPSARKSRRRFGAALEPFTSVRVELGRRKPGTDLRLLSSAEILRVRLGIARELERLALAAYLGELAFRLAPEGIPTDLGARLEAALDALDAHPASRTLRRAFELRLALELGLSPRLDACVACGAPATFLDFRRGGLLCAGHRGEGREIGPKTRAWLAHALASDAPAPSGALTPDEAERAARAVGPSLDLALRDWLDRPLGALPLLTDLGL